MRGTTRNGAREAIQHQCAAGVLTVSKKNTELERIASEDCLSKSESGEGPRFKGDKLKYWS